MARTLTAAGVTPGGPSAESESVLAWRYKCLLDAGFETSQCEQLAAAGYVDLHQAVALVERCGDPHLAFMILI